MSGNFLNVSEIKYLYFFGALEVVLVMGKCFPNIFCRYFGGLANNVPALDEHLSYCQVGQAKLFGLAPYMLRTTLVHSIQ